MIFINQNIPLLFVRTEIFAIDVKGTELFALVWLGGKLLSPEWLGIGLFSPRWFGTEMLSPELLFEIRLVFRLICSKTWQYSLSFALSSTFSRRMFLLYTSSFFEYFFSSARCRSNLNIIKQYILHISTTGLVGVPIQLAASLSKYIYCLIPYSE